jgi:hypothetical protein
MPIVDRLVAVVPEQLVRAVIPQRRDRRGVGEPDPIVVIHDPDRLRGRFQYCSEEVLGIDVRANQVGEGMGHAKPPSTVESTLGAARRSQRSSGHSRTLRTRHGSRNRCCIRCETAAARGNYGSAEQDASRLRGARLDALAVAPGDDAPGPDVVGRSSQRTPDRSCSHCMSFGSSGNRRLAAPDVEVRDV